MTTSNKVVKLNPDSVNSVKLNKTELIANISKRSGLTKIDAERALDAFMDSVKQAMKEHKEIRLIGFGNFYVTRRNATVARNPRTGEEIQIPETFLPKFKPGKQLKDATVEKQ